MFRRWRLKRKKVLWDRELKIQKALGLHFTRYNVFYHKERRGHLQEGVVALNQIHAIAITVTKYKAAWASCGRDRWTPDSGFWEVS